MKRLVIHWASAALVWAIVLVWAGASPGFGVWVDVAEGVLAFLVILGVLLLVAEREARR